MSAPRSGAPQPRPPAPPPRCPAGGGEQSTRAACTRGCRVPGAFKQQPRPASLPPVFIKQSGTSRPGPGRGACGRPLSTSPGAQRLKRNAALRCLEPVGKGRRPLPGQCWPPADFPGLVLPHLPITRSIWSPSADPAGMSPKLHRPDRCLQPLAGVAWRPACRPAGLVHVSRLLSL